MKNWLIISFSIVLFSLISISVAQAGCVDVTVIFNGDGCPVEGALVTYQNGGAGILGYTNVSGQVERCNLLGQDIYGVKAYYPDDETYFGSSVLIVDENGDGSASINDESGSCSSGYCVDGYCCDSACGGNCDRCDVSGSEGTCTAFDANCTGNCDYCNPTTGNCARDATFCTGDCDYCTGSGNNFNCAANETVCELIKCADCTRETDTHYDCHADLGFPYGENEDCWYGDYDDGCMMCVGLDECEPVANGSDPFPPQPRGMCGDETDCKYGYCDGEGHCAVKPNTTDCGTCALCDGLLHSGRCNVFDETQDEDCGFCEECSSLKHCGYADGTDPKGDCIGNCDVCNGTGGCTKDPTLCTGDCDYCTGSGNNFNCAANETVCELIKCADCTRETDTHYDCHADLGFPYGENEDCWYGDYDDGCMMCVGLDECGPVANGSDPFPPQPRGMCGDETDCRYGYCDGEGHCAMKPYDTECGEFRDCPFDACNGYFAEFYPDDGHDYCDGAGNCLVYSCSMEDFYCTDNNPLDGINDLICGAPCDENSDCPSNNCRSDCTCEPATCGITATPNPDFGSVETGQISTENSTTLTNTGNSPTTSLTIKGNDWTYSTYTMPVGQTHWNLTSGQDYETQMTLLTTSDMGLGQQVSPGSPLSVYFKLKIPEGQTQGNYDQTITFTASC